ncbi:hypothetical protein [Oceanotoga teriensis]|jgi:hypothetical protein|uniref:Uncharacterized protein n=1 Tax=Oceanotoga teriensis TaxID=515440 RepID=A0AA45C6D5_9BACT|nr:hypothetical protein [Oceanotoga teriensis]MDO7976014.1 hypothetical protein [Oceanotoga teriensis]PWJ92054.1 hypothetical protein C7380_11047 [Oceanotoga teriensis]
MNFNKKGFLLYEAIIYLLIEIIIAAAFFVPSLKITYEYFKEKSDQYFISEAIATTRSLSGRYNSKMGDFTFFGFRVAGVKIYYDGFYYYGRGWIIFNFGDLSTTGGSFKYPKSRKTILKVVPVTGAMTLP